MKERVEKIVIYLEESRETQASLSRSAGISVTVLNQILKGNYKGDVETNVSKIESAIQSQKDKKAIKFQAPEFIQTTIANKMFRAFSEAQSTAIPRILVLYGASGIGKTKTIEEYITDNPTVSLVKVRPEFTNKSLLKKIALKLGISCHGANPDLTDSIIDKLEHTNRMIIIDEAEYLTSKSLDILRRIHDEAQIPIVLVGMPNLYHNIKSLRKGFEQIANRMVSYNLGSPQKNDLLEIIESCIPNCEEGVTNAFVECSHGTIRTLILLMQDLVNFSSKKEKQLTVKQVHNFVNSMH